MSAARPLRRRSAATAAYPLTRDDAEHARLETQAAFWAADAAALFDSVPLAGGWRVADLGCGTLHVAQAMAARVGARGNVLALDTDAALVERLQSAPLPPPLQLRCADAFATGLPAQSLDAAHARFVAAPCGRLEALLGEMLRIVRPGGWILLQEPVADSWSVPAAGDAWATLKRLIHAGFETRGGHFDAGARLAPALARAPLCDLRVREVVHVLPTPHPYARLPLQFARSLRPLWRASGLASDDEIDAIVAEVERALTRAGQVRTFMLVQAWARVTAP